MQAVWRIGGWSFHVAQSASPLYQLHKKGIEPGFHCVTTLEGQWICFYAEELCANALRFHGRALVGIVHVGRSPTQELCLKSAGTSLCRALSQAKDAEWELMDRASTSGCYVNGDRITRHVVMPGGVTYLGNVMLLMGKDSILAPERTADIRLSEISYYKTVIEEKRTNTAICLTPGPVQKLTMEIELLSAKGTQENLPVTFVLEPSITMGLSSTAMGLFSFWLAVERKQDLLSMVSILLMSLSVALRTIL